MNVDEQIERQIRKNKVLGEHQAKGQHHMTHKTSQDFIKRSIANIKEHQQSHWKEK